MRGWVLFRGSANVLKKDTYSYECDRLKEEAAHSGIDLEIYAPEQFDLTVTREDKQSILLDGKPVDLPDFVIPRLGASTTYFSLAVVRHLERLGVYSVNSSQSIETVRDKLFAHQILAEAGLPVPKTMLVKFPVDVDRVEKLIGFPVVVKTLSGSHGSGVFLSENRQSFKDLMQLIEVSNSSMNIILQEYIEPSKGRDLRVLTIGGRVAACMERTAASEDEFKTNFSAGGEVKRFDVNPEIEWLATQTSQKLDLDFGGIDLLFGKDHFYICEGNSSPGFKGIESVCDINISQELFHFVRVRLGLFK